VPHDACVVYCDFADFAKTWNASQNPRDPPRRKKPVKWFQRRREVDPMPGFILRAPGPEELSAVGRDARLARA